MCFIPLEPRQHYGTSAGSFSSKNAKAEGTALGPRRRPTRGRGQSPRGCSARAVRPPRPRRANLSFPEAATTAAIPSSACDSRSHSAKPQLAEPQQPATAEVRPPCQETGHCIPPPGGSGLRDRCQGLGAGGTVSRNTSSQDGTPLSPVPHPQPQNQCGDHSEGHTATCPIS